MFRLTSRGMMDTTFGAGGRFVIATSELEFTPWAVVAQPDDQLIVAGNAMATNLCVVKVNLGPQVQAAPPADASDTCLRHRHLAIFGSSPERLPTAKIRMSLLTVLTPCDLNGLGLEILW